MSILEVKCEVWQMLSDETQTVLSSKHSISSLLPEVCNGRRMRDGKLKLCCIPCKKREERG